MKDQVIRARVEADLKAQAAEVLASLDLDLSDGIRLFLRQVVARRGLPFHVRAPVVRQAPVQELRRMKRVAQARDQALLEQGHFRKGELFLISPKRARAARVEWPKAKLSSG